MTTTEQAHFAIVTMPSMEQVLTDVARRQSVEITVAWGADEALQPGSDQTKERVLHLRVTDINITLVPGGNGLDTDIVGSFTGKTSAGWTITVTVAKTGPTSMSRTYTRSHPAQR